MSASNRSRWDVGRFFETLNEFGEIPFIGSFRWIQRMMGQMPNFSGIDMGVTQKKVAVLTPISDNQISDSTDFYQALKVDLWFRFLQALRSRLGSSIHFDFYPLSAEAEPSDALINLIRSADVVVLHEAFIPFTLMKTVADELGKTSDLVRQSVFTFGESKEELKAWGVLDDVVMGGVSQGGMALDSQGQAVFSGYVSTDNSGGFSSVRTQNFEPPFNFAGWEGLQLKVKGDGQRYKFILRDREGWDSPAFIYGFDTEPEAWMMVKTPFEQMVPTFRAKSMPDAPALNLAQIYSFQLMLSKFEYDRQLNPHFTAGPFSLTIGGISAYRMRQTVPLIVITDGDCLSEEWQTALARSKVAHRCLMLNDESLDKAFEGSLMDKLTRLLGERS